MALGAGSGGSSTGPCTTVSSGKSSDPALEGIISASDFRGLYLFRRDKLPLGSDPEALPS